MIARSKWTSSLVAVAVGCSLSSVARADAPPAAPAPAPTTAPAAAPTPAAEPAPAAAAAPAPAPAAAPAPPPWNSLVTVSGMVDSYYQFRFGTGGKANTPNEFRAFDTQNNSFQVGFTKLAIQTNTAPASLRLDFGFGNVVDSGLNVVQAGVRPYVEQAFASFALPMKITLDVGKFTTWAGAEVIESKDNWAYSRSMLFYSVPLTHTGVRAAWQVTDALALKLAVVNGWDVVVDNNPAKTIGFQLAYTAPTNTAIYLTTYQGVEASGMGGGLPWRQLYDLVLQQPFGDKFTLNLEGTGQVEKGGNFFGAALMGQVVPSSVIKITLRLEYVSDPDGAKSLLVGGVNLYEGTLTLGFPIGSNAEARLEFRDDMATKDYFVGATSKNQFTTTAAAIAWF